MAELCIVFYLVHGVEAGETCKVQVGVHLPTHICMNPSFTCPICAKTAARWASRHLVAKDIQSALLHCKSHLQQLFFGIKHLEIMQVLKSCKNCAKLMFWMVSDQVHQRNSIKPIPAIRVDRPQIGHVHKRDAKVSCHCSPGPQQECPRLKTSQNFAASTFIIIHPIHLIRPIHLQKNTMIMQKTDHLAGNSKCRCQTTGSTGQDVVNILN